MLGERKSKVSNQGTTKWYVDPVTLIIFDTLRTSRILSHSYIGMGLVIFSYLSNNA
jgi:hypothetical protein